MVEEMQEQRNLKKRVESLLITNSTCSRRGNETNRRFIAKWNLPKANVVHHAPFVSETPFDSLSL